MLLPDVNVWLAMAFESHLHHVSAKQWFEVAGNDGCSFCRMTQQGFLRLATNPKAFGSEAVTLSDAWGLYDAFMADPRIAFAPEPTNLDTLWRSHTQRRTFSHKVWNDAFLAAFAQAADLTLITFDQGFQQYHNLNATILS